MQKKIGMDYFKSETELNKIMLFSCISFINRFKTFPYVAQYHIWDFTAQLF